MKFEKDEKSGNKNKGSKKKYVIGLVIGVIALAFIILPIVLGGLK